MIEKIQNNKIVTFAAVFILTMIIFAIFAPLVATHDPSKIDACDVLAAPSRVHIFGTDTLGRDIFSRVVYGSRISLAISFTAVILAVFIGVLFGSAAGYYGGKIDYCIMRFVDILLCFPTLFLILAVVAILEPSIWNIIVVIGATSWMGVARLVRAEVLTLKTRDYISAAKIMGASDARIILKHLIPNAIGPVVVSATLGVGGAILLESSLSFLGIGVQPPTPSWGNILMDGRSTLGVAWWLTVYPGLFIMFTVLSYNILGEYLRDCFEPRLKR